MTAAPSPTSSTELSTPSSKPPHTLPDLLRAGSHAGLDLVFAGINPGEYSAHAGHYYGHPGNGFWSALSASPLVDRELGPSDDRSLPAEYGIGFTDVVKRVVTDSARVSDRELRAAAAAFEGRIAYASPRAVCFTTTRAFDVLHPGVRVSGAWGRQPVALAGTIGGAELWVMPSTSGRAAGWREEVHRVLADLAVALGRPDGSSRERAR